MAKRASKGQRKIHRVLGEYKRGTLRSSSGARVTKRSQALAIAMAESGRAKARRKR